MQLLLRADRTVQCSAVRTRCICACTATVCIGDRCYPAVDQRAMRALSQQRTKAETRDLAQSLGIIEFPVNVA